MSPSDLAAQRLRSQRISRPTAVHPEETIQWLGAVQAQDYIAAKWAVGLRSVGTTDSELEHVISDGRALRTHVMRPTWHFIAPADIRWLLALTAPRVIAAMAYQQRQLGFDVAMFAHSNCAMRRALEGGRQLTRSALIDVLRGAGFELEALGYSHLLMRAEIDAVICSGGRRGNQFAYALLDDRVPPARDFDREEALAMLARRYFTSHGPATTRDFSWWSGLAARDARAGLDAVCRDLTHRVVDGMNYWFVDEGPAVSKASQRAYLLPNYDEYLVGYSDRSAVFNVAHAAALDARGSVLAQHAIVLDGLVVGTWKRTLKKDGVVIATSCFEQLGKTATRAIEAAAARYGAFLELPVTVRAM